MDFDESLSIFWSETQALIAIYAIYALLACLVLSVLERRRQTSSAPASKFLIKAVALTAADVVLATLAMYVTSWQSGALGEIPTGLVVGAAWYGALYTLNGSFRGALGLASKRPRLDAHLPVVVLMLPCVLLFVFVMALGSAWSI